MGIRWRLTFSYETSYEICSCYRTIHGLKGRFGMKFLLGWCSDGEGRVGDHLILEYQKSASAPTASTVNRCAYKTRRIKLNSK